MKRFFSLISMIAVASMMAVSCSDDDDDSTVNSGNNDSTGDVTATGELTISVSTNIIQANGVDGAVFTVKLDGVTVTNGVSIYDGSTNEKLELTNLTFTTTTSGSYTFWAAYGSNITASTVTVNAVDFEIPDLPSDPQETSTSFHRNLFLIDFTGSGCGYCPSMTNSIRDLLEDETYSANMVWAGLHSYNSSDNAYYSYKSTGYSSVTTGSSVAGAFGISGYPKAVLDMYESSDSYSTTAMKALFRSVYNRTGVPSVGVCAASTMDDSQIAVTVGAKAGEAGTYRVGAWLLEDGIYSVQTAYVSYGVELDDDYDYNTHNNCVRAIEGRYSTYDYSGISLGTLAAGEEANYAFCFNLDSDWDTAEMHIIAIVTYENSDGEYSVANAIDFVAGESMTYQYE